jgi:hypothetical protein
MAPAVILIGRIEYIIERRRVCIRSSSVHSVAYTMLLIKLCAIAKQALLIVVITDNCEVEEPFENGQFEL